MNEKEKADKEKAGNANDLSDKEIIERIFIESGTPYFKDGENVGKSVAYFAVLISRLSAKGDKIQKRVFWLNFFIAALTMVLLLTIPQFNKFAFDFVVSVDTLDECCNAVAQKHKNNSNNNDVTKSIHDKTPNNTN